nr:MAG TPA: hypothetical protein [Caudoviricetes sp.]
MTIENRRLSEKLFQCPKWSTLRRRDTSRVKFTA